MRPKYLRSYEGIWLDIDWKAENRRLCQSLDVTRLGQSIVNKKNVDEAAESCTIDGESPVVKKKKSVLSRVAWDTWNPV